MSSDQSLDSFAVKSKKGAGNGSPPVNPVSSGPTTFVLKSEKELEKDAQRGRQGRQHADDESETRQRTPMASLMADSSFGVQSLEDTISSAFGPESGLMRTTSNSSDGSTEERSERGLKGLRKRAAGNPVHPEILATGQRIISSGRAQLYDSYSGSPSSLKSTNSPLRTHGIRRGSTASSINISQPITPLKVSPHPELTTPSTPRSASPKSFRLSDEEGSVADETNSQAIVSSNDDEDIEYQSSAPMPQLVMPSLPMPVRRPFTEQGRNMGRARILLVGPKGIGKSSFIQSVFRSSEHIVHVDPTTASETSHTLLSSDGYPYQHTTRITEVLASTRPYPSWWNGESLRFSQSRKGFGEGALERNLTFVDTPGIQAESDVQCILDYLCSSLQRATTIDHMSESELVHLLSGEGGVQIDAAIYMFDPTPTASDADTPGSGLGPIHQELIRGLSKFTNLIPLIGRADTVSPETLSSRKTQIRQLLNSIDAAPYQLMQDRGPASMSASTVGIDLHEPCAVSSAVGDDADVIDASLLMSSQYMQPLVPSDLPLLLEQLLSPAAFRRMRHTAAMKIAAWREVRNRTRIDLQQQRGVASPISRFESTGSVLEEPTGIHAPYRSTSRYRSASPPLSDLSGLSSDGVQASAYALAKYNDQTQPSEPFRQIRLAKWAQDLQRSLHNESRRYRDMYTNRPAEWTLESDSEKHDTHALVSTKATRRPARGRLGGDLGVIDPRDPLGVLAIGQALGRHGLIAVQIAGSCGLLGAVAFWAIKHWIEVQEFFGFAQPVTMVHVAAVPPPSRSMMGWLDEAHLRNLFSWGR